MPGTELPDDPIVEEIESLARSLDLPGRYRELDRAPAFPRAESPAMGRASLLGIHFPVDVGGRGLSLARVGVALFRLAYVGGTTFAKLSLQPEFASVLAEHGSPDQVDRRFRPLMKGERLVGYHVTEPEAG